MKKTILMLAAVCIALSGAAQNQSTTNTNSNAAGGENVEVKETTDKNWGGNSGASFLYDAVEHGFGLSFRLMLNGFFAQYDQFYQDIKEYKMDSSSWDIKAGYSYRYWFGKHIYVQIPLSIGYLHSTVEIRNGKKKDKTSDSGCVLSVNPAVGLRIWDGWTIEAGYDWDFTDFKFDKAHKTDYFNIGIAYTM